MKRPITLDLSETDIERQNALAAFHAEPETLGTRLARENRAACNDHNPEQRADLVANAMEMIREGEIKKSE